MNKTSFSFDNTRSVGNKASRQEGTAALDTHLVEHLVSRQPLLEGAFLRAVADTVLLPNGEHAPREYILHPGAVMIIALTDDGQVVMERQYRHPMQQVMWEMPAGKRDPGESSQWCGQRELLEETGYEAREWAYAGKLAPTIAYSDEIIDIWFARGLILKTRKLDEGEALDVVLWSAQQLAQACQSGQVFDSKTVIGAWWLDRLLSGQWQANWQGAQTSESQSLIATAVV